MREFSIGLAFAYLVAAFSDIADYVLVLVFGMPLVGRLFDLIAFILLLPLLGKYAIFSFIEVPPVVGDVATYLPMHLIGVALSHSEALGGNWDLKTWSAQEED